MGFLGLYRVTFGGVVTPPPLTPGKCKGKEAPPGKCKGRPCKQAPACKGKGLGTSPNAGRKGGRKEKKRKPLIRSTGDHCRPTPFLLQHFFVFIHL